MADVMIDAKKQFWVSAFVISVELNQHVRGSAPHQHLRKQNQTPDDVHSLCEQCTAETCMRARGASLSSSPIFRNTN